MSHSIGKLLSSLRKAKDMTQAEVAQYLDVTDKAVSKWEIDAGVPDIAIIPKIAEFFGITIDQLLTGRVVEQPKQISKFEKCVIEDNVGEFSQLVTSIPNFFGNKDENNKTIMDYLLVYLSPKIIKYLLDYRMIQIRGFKHGDAELSKFVLVILMVFGMESVSKIGAPLINLAPKELLKQQIYSRGDTYAVLTDDFFRIFASDSRISDSLFAQLTDSTMVKEYWHLAIPHLLHHSYVNNLADKFTRLISGMEDVSQKALNGMNMRNQETYQRMQGFGGNSYVIKSDYEYLVASVLEKTFHHAIDKKDFDTVKRFNNLNKLINTNQLANTYVYNETELATRIAKNNPASSAIDIARASVTEDGLINIDKLIALDDFDIYQELIKLPTSRLEALKMLADAGNYKAIFDFAWEHNNTQLLEFFKDNPKSKIDYFLNPHSQPRDEHILKFFYPINRDYYTPSKPASNIQRSVLNYHNQKTDNSLGKNQLFLSKIKELKDIRFMKKYYEDNPNEIHRIFNVVLNTRPLDEPFIYELLLQGAKIYKVEDSEDDEGYKQSYEYVDELGTKVLLATIENLRKSKGE